MMPIRCWIAVGLLCSVPIARGDCLPSGRATFAAGLEALSRGDLPVAAATFDGLVKAQPDCAEAHNNLAAVLVEQGHLGEAAEHLRKALELRPDYQRARLNLDRLQVLLAARTEPTATTKARIEVEPAPTAPQVVARAEAQPTATPPATLTPMVPTPVLPTPVQPSPVPPTVVPAHAPSAVPAGVVALEPPGATACVIDPAQKRICVFRRTSEGIAADACYAILRSQVDPWPRWSVVSDMTARRMHLVDETGARRFKVAGETYTYGGEVVRLREADFAAFSKQVGVWRSWMVLAADAGAPAVDATGLRALLEQWRQAWEQKRFDDYLGFYSSAFVPQGEPSTARWQERKRLLFTQSAAIAVQLEAVNIFAVDAGKTVLTSFEQTYRSAGSASRCIKVLRWQRDGEGWRISAETVLQEESAAPAQPGAGG